MIAIVWETRTDKKYYKLRVSWFKNGEKKAADDFQRVLPKIMLKSNIRFVKRFTGTEKEIQKKFTEWEKS